MDILKANIQYIETEGYFSGGALHLLRVTKQMPGNQKKNVSPFVVDKPNAWPPNAWPYAIVQKQMEDLQEKTITKSLRVGLGLEIHQFSWSSSHFQFYSFWIKSYCNWKQVT